MSAQRPNPAAVDLIAQRVVEMLEPRLLEALEHLEDSRGHDDHDGRLVGPAEIARQLGRSPEWVRDHSEDLGVIRFGNGGKPRLWFDPDVVRERLRERGMNGDTPQPSDPRVTEPARRRRHTRTSAPLLEIKGASRP